MGGGASYFTQTFQAAGGAQIIPSTVTWVDAGLFIQDDWKVRPNVTLSYGLRFETQNNFSDKSDFAPRLGLAWGIGEARRTHRRQCCALDLGCSTTGLAMTGRNAAAIQPAKSAAAATANTESAFFLPVPSPVPAGLWFPPSIKPTTICARHTRFKPVLPWRGNLRNLPMSP